MQALAIILHLLWGCAFSLTSSTLHMPSLAEREHPDTFRLLPAQTHGKSFLAGSVHRDWVMIQEQGCLDVADRAMANKTACFALDVGMNDGFFTQLAASYGCQVYSFELQPSCIAISRNATSANGFGHLVTIFRAPVSKAHGELLLVPHGDDEAQHRCDGGLSVDAQFAHKKFAIQGHHPLYTVSLDALVPVALAVDFLKIDVEGHDVEVLQGAEELFRSHRIKRAVIEVTRNKWTAPFDQQMLVYQRIIQEHHYRFHCATIFPHSTDLNVTRTDLRYEDFYGYVKAGNKCIDWEFFPAPPAAAPAAVPALRGRR